MRRLLLVLTLVSAACMTNPADSSNLDDGDLGSSVEPQSMQGMVAAHNEVRAAALPKPQPAMPDLVWSSTIADIAQEYAEECVFEHSGRAGLGENLYVETGGTSSPAQVVQSWAGEKPYYSYASNTCQPNPYNTCGHYTQIIWGTTLHVGCGMARCTKNSPFNNGNAWNNWVCNYDPPGNYVGQRPY